MKLTAKSLKLTALPALADDWSRGGDGGAGTAEARLAVIAGAASVAAIAVSAGLVASVVLTTNAVGGAAGSHADHVSPKVVGGGLKLRMESGTRTLKALISPSSSDQSELMSL